MNWKLGLILALGLSSYACDSECGVICDKTIECVEPDLDEDECVDTCEQLVEDGVIPESVRESCADCVGDKTCGELSTGDCDAECSFVVGERG